MFISFWCYFISNKPLVKIAVNQLVAHLINICELDDKQKNIQAITVYAVALLVCKHFLYLN